MHLRTTQATGERERAYTGEIRKERVRGLPRVLKSASGGITLKQVYLLFKDRSGAPSTPTPTHKTGKALKNTCARNGDSLRKDEATKHCLSPTHAAVN